MKILHLLKSNKFSGAENVVTQIIKMFQDEIEMVYCSPKGEINDKLDDLNIEYYTMEKFDFKNLKKVIEEYNPDLIHAHDIGASILASFFFKKIPVVSHLHGNLDYMKHINIKTILYKNTIRKYKKIICVSKSIKKDFIFSKKIKDSLVLYNIIQSKFIDKMILEDNNVYEYDVVYLGRLTYPKNPEKLIEVIKEIKKAKKNIKVAIIGDGELLESVKKLITKYELENNIKLYGYLKNPYKILSNSKIMLMTSRYEGTPMCVLEAQYLGVPIVATPVDGLKDIIISEYNGYLENDVISLSKKVIKILENEVLLNKLSSNSKKFFLSYNNIDNYKNKLRNIYYNLGE